MSDRPSATLCVIARNEEEFLPSCINSVRHLVDEIIVVDTGSADKTREVALQNGAQVFSFSWKENFAAARNYALELATGDWILVLDADEVLGSVEAEEFARLLANPNVEGYFVQIRNYLDGGRGVAEDQVVRLFRNRPGYRFEGAIHEQVAASILRANAGSGLAWADLVIHHFGYLDRHLRAKKKYQRNVSIITRALGRNPTDPFLLYCLGIEHLQHNEIEEGIQCLENSLALMRGSEGYFRDALIALGAALLQAGDKEKLMRFLTKALQMLPDDPDLNLLQGMAALRDGPSTCAVQSLRRALVKGSRLLPDYQVLTLLGDACNGLARYEEAEEAYFKALCLAPHLLYSLIQILSLRRRGQGTLAWETLSRFAALATKMALGQDLNERGEVGLALVLFLLAIVDASLTAGAEALAAACGIYRRALEGCRNTPEAWHAYLSASAHEMEVRAAAASRGFKLPLFSPLQGLYEVALHNLELVTLGLCPAQAPRAQDPAGGVTGEKGAHRQPGTAEAGHFAGIPVVPGTT